jgi:hypothetical protein
MLLHNFCNGIVAVMQKIVTVDRDVTNQWLEHAWKLLCVRIVPHRAFMLKVATWTGQTPNGSAVNVQ